MLSFASKAFATVNTYLSPMKNMAIPENMELFEARLATFTSAPAIGRKRASTAKGAKEGKWSLKNPSPEQLAQAGFYFAPTAPGSDNVTCFCCEKSLDGWEEGDHAFSEHLHFSSECPWAIIMAIENDVDEALKIEDPMSERMVEARRQTFRNQWPHEKKRGWTCKVQKMIEGGWYYSPSPEGEDQANCAYCKKSLFGWEKKDEPYDEHKSRSPDCAFFLASQTKPATKGKKPRASKASRASIQSIATIEIDESPDAHTGVDETQASMMTVDMSMASTTSKAKKGTRAKKATSKTAKNKAAKAPIEVVEIVDEAVQEESAALPRARAKRGTKRTSEQMLEDSVNVIEPPKKRATRTRGSAIKAPSREPSLVLPDANMGDAELSTVVQKKGGRKRASSTTRKASTRVISTESTASKATLQGAIADDEEIDAQLEAELENYNSDDGSDNWKVLGEDSVMSQAVPPRPIRMSNTTAYVPHSRGKVNASVIEDRSEDVVMTDSVLEAPLSAPVVAIAKKSKAKPGHKGKRAVSKTIIAHPEPAPVKIMDLEEFERSLEAEDREFASATELKQGSSVFDKDIARTSQATLATVADDSSHETDSSLLAQNNKRESKKGKTVAKAKQPTKKNIAKVKHSTAAMFQPAPDIHDDDVAEELSALRVKMELENARPAEPIATHKDVSLDLVQPPTPRATVLSQEQQPMSPEASLQGSDAENQPPSSRPSQTRPPLARFSPSGARTVRIALAPSTPTASPSKTNPRLETTYPWAPADIEYILTGTPAGNRENIDLKNILNSEEKKMTLQEWICWNAKKNEDRLKADCERMVGKFESEGVRALKTLEGIVCTD